MLVLTLVFFVVMLGLGGMHNREVGYTFPKSCLRGRDVGM
jgi:hypothetical protein